MRTLSLDHGRTHLTMDALTRPPPSPPSHALLRHLRHTPSFVTSVTRLPSSLPSHAHKTLVRCIDGGALDGGALDGGSRALTDRRPSPADGHARFLHPCS